MRYVWVNPQNCQLTVWGGAPPARTGNGCKEEERMWIDFEWRGTFHLQVQELLHVFFAGHFIRSLHFIRLLEFWFIYWSTGYLSKNSYGFGIMLNIDMYWRFQIIFCKKKKVHLCSKVTRIRTATHLSELRQKGAGLCHVCVAVPTAVRHWVGTIVCTWRVAPL